MHYAGPVVAGDAQHHLTLRLLADLPLGEADGETRQHHQRLAQATVMLIGDADMQDAGKLSRQLAHGAGQPVALLLGDDVGQTLDDTGLVRADHGDDQLLLHPALLRIGFL
ncbi:hypothetical protein D3C79_611420 [compost metagenome]